MTTAVYTSRKTDLPTPTGPLDERSRRAREEPMAVTSFGTDLYEVESASGETYTVDVTGGRCTCPDHLFRNVRCKHLRRVAIEITEGRVPPPGFVADACAVCDDPLWVERDARQPRLCDDHELRVGSVVHDRERGGRLVVVGFSDRRADEVPIERTHTVADHYSNAPYPADDPVVFAVYPGSLREARDGSVPPTLRVYSFPRSRLRPVEQRPEHREDVRPVSRRADVRPVS